MAIRGSLLVLITAVFYSPLILAVDWDSIRNRSGTKVGVNPEFSVQESVHCNGEDLPSYLPRAEIESVCREVNRIRSQRGLSPVRLREDLCGVAQEHSRDMAVRDVLSHKNRYGQSSSDRLDDAGIRVWASAENVASGYLNAQRVVSAWMDSSGHRRNILYPDFEWMGVGFEDSYWTQVFVAD